MSNATTDTNGTGDAEAAERDDQPIEQPDTAPEDTEPTEDNANAEAAKYRRRLRDAEKQLAETTEKLNAVQRQQVETLIANTGLKPTALWSVTEVAELLADDGSIDAEKVTAAVESARERFGIPKLPKGNHVPGVGGQPTMKPRLGTWEQAFAPKRR